MQPISANSDQLESGSHRIMGAIKCMEGDFVASRHHHERAIELAPNDAYIAGRCAAFYTYVNEAERALELLDRAEMLDPFLPVWIVEERVAALYVLGRHDELFAVARALPYQTRRTLIYRIAARMARGDVDRARQLVAQIQALDPKLSAGYVRTQEFFKDRAITETLVNSVHAAGLPLV